MQNNNFGHIAYDAYVKSSGGVSLVSGETLPAFDALKPEIQQAWNAAGNAVVESVPVKAAA